MLEGLAAVAMAVLGAIHPQAPRTGSALGVAQAAAYVVEHDGKPPAGWTAERAVAAMVDLAWHESRLNPSAVGAARCVPRGDGQDCHAYGAWQVEHHPELLGNIVAQARYAYAIVRSGAAMCPEHPLAEFAGGCNVLGTKRPNLVARRIADARLAEADAALGATHPEPTEQEWLDMRIDE